MRIFPSPRRRLLRLMVACGVLAALIVIVHPRELLETLGAISAESIVYLALLSIALIYVSALKWGVFLDYLGSRVPVLRLFALYLVGYFVNLLLPSYLGGDVVRSYVVGKRVGQHEAAAATVLERYTGLVAMVVLALVCMWFVDGVSIPIKIVVVAVAMGVGVLTMVALSSRLMKLLGSFSALEAMVPHLCKVQQGFSLVRGNRRILLSTLALSLLFHTLTVVNTLVAAHAVGWYQAPLVDLFVVLPLILLFGAIPIAPQGLGILEGAFVYFLCSIGATPQQALGIALVLRAKSYLLALLGGAVWLMMNRERQEYSPCLNKD